MLTIHHSDVLMDERKQFNGTCLALILNTFCGIAIPVPVQRRPWQTFEGKGAHQWFSVYANAANKELYF